MKRITLVFVLLLFAALYVYFLGTPLLAGVTGIAPRTVSLLAGFSVILSGIGAMMATKFSAQHSRED